MDLVLEKDPVDHYNNGNKKHEQGDAVHTMHHLYVHIPGIGRVSFAQVEVSKNLLPNTTFHNFSLFYKITEKIGGYPYICSPQGELAQLARALAWHARGHRFDSVILHFNREHRIGVPGFLSRRLSGYFFQVWGIE